MSKKLPGLTRVERETGPKAEPGAPSAPVTEKPKASAAPATANRTDAVRSKPASTSGSAAGPKPAASKSSKPKSSSAAQSASPTKSTEPAKEQERAQETPASALSRDKDSVAADAAVPAVRGDTANAADRTRSAAARAIVARASGWSVAGGLFPLPVANILAVSVVQVRMIGALARLYGVPFSKTRGRAVLSSIVGGVVPQTLTSFVANGVLKSMPGVGLCIGLAGAIGLSSAGTRVLGMMFIRHFEEGGTLASADTDEMRAEFRKKVLPEATGRSKRRRRNRARSRRKSSSRAGSPA